MSRSILQCLCLVLSLTSLPEAGRAPQRSPVELASARSTGVDPGTAGRILELFNRAQNAGELAAATGLDELTAAVVLQGRARRPGGKFASFADMDDVWRLDAHVFPTVYGALGPTRMGLWDTLPYSLPYHCAHSILVHTGRVLFLPESDMLNSLLWDPSDLQEPHFLTPSNEPLASLFCSGHAQMSDGRVLFAGGGGRGPAPDSMRAFAFDPDAPGNGRWDELHLMQRLRWYPTVVALGGGKMLIACGANLDHHPVAPMEVYDEATDEFTLVAASGSDPEGANLAWNEDYPGLHLLPSGQILFTRAGSGSDNDRDTPTRVFTWTDPLHPDTGRWVDTPRLAFPDRTKSFSVQLPIRSGPRQWLPRVAVFGGGDPVEEGRRTVEVFEGEDVARSRWVRKPDMAEPRFHCIGVLLPDGDVLVTGGLRDGGGGTQGSHSSELYDPETATFTRQDDMEWARGYHPLCALLPSGQVMIAGGREDVHELTIEVFSPPYLFRGPRPRIAAAPEAIAYGSSFDVTTPDAERVERAVLVRPMAFTHNTDSEQRVVELALRRGVERVTIKAPGGAPPHANAPDGYYMLFLLDVDGVPSVARFLRLGA